MVDVDGETDADPEKVAGVIISGGRSQRWGDGDKFLAKLNGKNLLEHVVSRIQPQTCFTVLNANQNVPAFRNLHLTVVPDTVVGDQGPLAGVLTGLDWVRENLPGVKWVVTVPSDAPFLPRDLVARLLAAVVDEGAELACAVSGGRTHPVIGLWPVALCDQLRQSLVFEGVRKIDAWTANFKLAQVEWPSEPRDPFFNINTKDDLKEAEELIG